MKSLFKDNLLPISLYLLLLIVAGYFMYAFERNNVHLFINQYVGNRYANAFFYYITYAGDGRFATVIIAVVLAFNIRLGLTCLLSFAIAALAAALLKYYFFDDMDRPSFIFRYIAPAELKTVEGVTMHIHNSFPSGHATQAFAVFTCLFFAARSLPLKLALLGVAVLTSFSRVYLSQHFLTDITGGSIIGFLIAILIYWLVIARNKFPSLNRPLKSFRSA